MGFEVFFGIVRFEILNLSLDHQVKIFKDMTNFRFFFHEEYPCESCIIIHRGNKPMSTCKIFNSCCSPNITMNHGKWTSRHIWNLREIGSSVFCELIDLTIE